MDLKISILLVMVLNTYGLDVTFIAVGESAYERGNRLGWYEAQRDIKHNGLGVWKQVDSYTNDSSWLYYHESGHWQVSKVLGKTRAPIRSKSDTALPPLHDWEFLSEGLYREDPTLHLETGTLDHCIKLHVTLPYENRVGIRTSTPITTLLGIYYFEGYWKFGRPVYKKDDAAVFLSVGKSKWRFSTSATNDNGKPAIISRFASNYPDHYCKDYECDREGSLKWSYFDQRYKDPVDFELTVECTEFF